MNIDLDAIEAAARAAQRADLDGAWFSASLLPRTTFLSAEAHHIATMDPQTTLALVERVRELEQRTKDLHADASCWEGVARAAQERVAHLESLFSAKEILERQL